MQIVFFYIQIFKHLSIFLTLDKVTYHFKYKLPKFRIEAKHCEWKQYGMHERGEKRKDGIFVFNFRNDEKKRNQNKKAHDY